MVHWFDFTKFFQLQFLLLESNVHEIIIEEYSSDLASSYRLTIIAERRHACHQFRSSGLTFFSKV